MIIRVFLDGKEIMLLDVTGDRARTRTGMRVNYFIAGFCVVLEKPAIKGDGFLRGVNTNVFIFHIFLDHAVPRNFYFSHSFFGTAVIVADFFGGGLRTCADFDVGQGFFAWSRHTAPSAQAGKGDAGLERERAGSDAEVAVR